MPENISQQHESYAEQLTTAEHIKALPTPEQAEALRVGEPDPQQRAQEALAAANEQAAEENPLHRLEAAETVAQEPQIGHVNRELKAITLRRELQQIRRKLPASQRALSQVIHQPAVRAISAAASNSVSRPSGLLGGGIVAFLGCTSYLYLAKHIGFSYNYFVFLLLFVAGFGVGLVLELAVWAVTRRHRQLDI